MAAADLTMESPPSARATAPPVRALKAFTKHDEDWSLSHGELRFAGILVGHFSSNDHMDQVFVEMVGAFLQSEYPELNRATREALTTDGVQVWRAATVQAMIS